MDDVWELKPSAIPDEGALPGFNGPDDLLDALVRYSDVEGRYQAHPKIVARLCWWQDAVTHDVIAQWLGELEARGDIEIRRCVRAFPNGLSLGLQILHRDRFERFQGRRHIPLAVRRAVYERDGHACVACGADGDLTLDHIHPFSLGGSDDPKNLQTMCRRCNCSKGARI